MQEGSLVECVFDNWEYTGSSNILLPSIFPKKGDIGICDELEQDVDNGEVYLRSSSWPGFWWNIKGFQEIQPPMIINIEEIIKQEIEL